MATLRSNTRNFRNTGDANLMANLRQGITEAKSAQGIDWESAKRELDL